MYRIIDRRGTGKTSRLLLLAKENNGIIVCQNPEIMRKQSYRYGITGIDFISYDSFSSLYYYEKPIYIDELDLYLKHLNKDIQGYTISNED